MAFQAVPRAASSGIGSGPSAFFGTAPTGRNDVPGGTTASTVEPDNFVGARYEARGRSPRRVSVGRSGLTTLYNLPFDRSVAEATTAPSMHDSRASSFTRHLLRSPVGLARRPLESYDRVLVRLPARSPRAAEGRRRAPRVGRRPCLHGVRFRRSARSRRWTRGSCTKWTKRPTGTCACSDAVDRARSARCSTRTASTSARSSTTALPRPPSRPSAPRPTSPATRTRPAPRARPPTARTRTTAPSTSSSGFETTVVSAGRCSATRPSAPPPASATPPSLTRPPSPLRRPRPPRQVASRPPRPSQ